MDALTAFGVNWKLLLIQGLNFGILLLVLYRFLYRPLLAMLEKRREVIAKGLKDAEAASKERERVIAEKEAIILSAREEGGKISEGIRKQALAAEKETLRDAQEKSAALVAEARAKADAEREHLMRESEKEIARLAVLAAEKVLRTKHS